MEAGENTVHLALAVDRHYETGAVVTMASAIRNLGAGYRMKIWLIDCGLEHPRELARSLDPLQKGQFEIVGRGLELGAFREVAVFQGHVNRTAFAKLKLAEILPEVDRVIFLDADTLVKADLARLWEVDLEGFPVGAVVDGGVRVLGNDLQNAGELGMDPQAPYFNSGVLLANLRQWREEEREAQMMAWATSDRLRRRYHDQSFLNAAFTGNWLALDPSWNCLTLLFPKNYHKVPWRPAILHMAHTWKPWLYPEKGSVGLIRLFYRYLNLTTWKEVKRETPIFENRFPVIKEAYLWVRFYLGELGLDRLRGRGKIIACRGSKGR